MKKCPYCDTDISESAVKCKFCRQRVAGVEEIDGRIRSRIQQRQREMNRETIIIESIAPKVFLKGIYVILIITVLSGIWFFLTVDASTDYFLGRVVGKVDSRHLVPPESIDWFRQQVGFFIVFRALFIICAIALIYGKNWSRRLFICLCLVYVAFYSNHIYNLTQYFRGFIYSEADTSSIVYFLWSIKGGLIFMLLYPIGVIIYLLLPHVKKQFN